MVPRLATRLSTQGIWSDLGSLVGLLTSNAFMQFCNLVFRLRTRYCEFFVKDRMNPVTTNVAGS